MTSGPGINFRFRDGGSDRTTSDYINATQGLTAANAADNLTGTFAVAKINQGVNTVACKNSLDVFDPFVAANKSNVIGTGIGSNTGGTTSSFRVGFLYAVANSNDGFSIIAEAGTITGSVSVYGYQD